MLAWAYTFAEAARMSGAETPPAAVAMPPAAVAMPTLSSWTPARALVVFVMWAIMMVAMMVPSAAPMVLLYAAVNRKKRQRAQPYVPTGIFLGGYLTAWTLFSAVATLVQWALHSAALLSPMMVSTSPAFGGLILAAAGIFQVTPLKNTCLHHCRSPLAFLSIHWRDGYRGAFAMGFHHGVFCVGCCWLLMLLLFVTGVMNLVWVAIIAVFVLAEKVVPATAAPWVSRMAGAVLIVGGAVVFQGP